MVNFIFYALRLSMIIKNRITYIKKGVMCQWQKYESAYLNGNKSEIISDINGKQRINLE